MIRRPPRSTPLYSSAASDVYKRQAPSCAKLSVSSLRLDSDTKATCSVVMSDKETPMSTDESSTSESESSASSSPVERHKRRRPCATTPAPEKPADQGAMEAASSTATARRKTEVRGSKGGGSGAPLAQPLAEAPGGCRVGSGLETRPVYTPQACRLCCRPTVYLTRSGLSDHATVHHGHWYSAKRDEYVPIPEAELAAKRELIKRGQAHRKFRQDPADKPPRTDGQD